MSAADDGRIEMAFEFAFEMSASNIRFGPGVTREVGMDPADLRAQRVMAVTDQKRLSKND